MAHTKVVQVFGLAKIGILYCEDAAYFCQVNVEAPYTRVHALTHRRVGKMWIIFRAYGDFGEFSTFSIA